ncbi:MAG TPA: SAM-dependent methyltransferase [Candidatus Mediterraneibacter surreyensis]|nr:SAM-dependent methyltransferase [Candidatus Mediterraneibacter surreyensis]
MITKEMRMRLLESMRDEEEGNQRQFLLNFLIMRKVNIEFLALHQAFEKESFEEAEDPENYKMYGVPYISEGGRWENLRDSGGVTANRLQYAFVEICRQCPEYQKILEQDESWTQVGDRLRETAYDIFSELQEDKKNPLDFLEMYEYVMAFASPLLPGTGEYYSPREIGQLMARLLDLDEGVLYDPCCGSGSLLIEAAIYRKKMQENGNHAADGRLRLYGQEMSPDAWKTAKMNLLMHDMEADLGNYAENVFIKDLHPDLRADYIVANPPFVTGEWGNENSYTDPRWIYGVPPKKKSSFAWLQHMLYHLGDNGRMTVVLSAGSLEGGAASERKIRQRMIEDDVIEGVILLPAGLFYFTRILTAVWIVSRRKSPQCRKKILFINGRNMGEKGGKIVKLKEKEINRICDIWKAYNEGSGEVLTDISAEAELENIRRKEYSLFPDKYIWQKKEKLSTYSELESEEGELEVRLAELWRNSQVTMYEIIKGLEKISE